MASMAESGEIQKSLAFSREFGSAPFFPPFLATFNFAKFSSRHFRPRFFAKKSGAPSFIADRPYPLRPQPYPLSYPTAIDHSTPSATLPHKNNERQSKLFRNSVYLSCPLGTGWQVVDWLSVWRRWRRSRRSRRIIKQYNSSASTTNDIVGYIIGNGIGDVVHHS